jgi:hypothetical protein
MLKGRQNRGYEAANPAGVPKMNGRSLALVAALILVGQCDPTRAQVLSAVNVPVNHPLVAVNSIRSPAIWRKGIEGFGESLVRIALPDYEVADSKIRGNQGIDLIAIKRDAVGVPTDIRLIEVKTHYGIDTPHLGQTRHGLQTSRTWFADRLRQLRSSGSDGKARALEISRFRKSKGVPIEQLGEIHDINLRSMNYSIRSPVTLAERPGTLPISELLSEATMKVSPTRHWALEHLAASDQIRQARMGAWLLQTPSERALSRVTATQLVEVERKFALRGAGRILLRNAGRVTFVLAVALDAYEIYGHLQKYRAGRISRQEFVVAIARSSGGIAGAWAGATGGAWAGAWVGAFGGPFAWVTVPVGGFVGGTVGGIAGYFAGSYVGDLAAQAWYRSLDQKVKTRIDKWLISTGTPNELKLPTPAARAITP